MRTSTFVDSITVTDPDTKKEMKLSVFKHDNGKMFAVDSQDLDNSPNTGKAPVILDPFAETQYGDSTVALKHGF